MNARLPVEDVQDLLVRQFPDTDGAVLRAIVAEVARPKSARRLAAFLQQHPLTTLPRELDIPAVGLKLLAALANAGIGGIKAPVCADCGQERRLRRVRSDGARVCESCAHRDPATWRECARCHRNRTVVAREADGSALCDTCYQRPAEACVTCGKNKPVKARGPNGPLCQVCHARTRTPRPCGGCGQTRSIVIKANGDHPDLCGSCYNGPRKPCSKCGKVRACRGVRSGQYLCLSCTPRPQAACSRCQRIRDVKTRWPIGPVCPGCYHYIRANPRPCPSCGDRQPMIGHDAAGTPCCGPCAGSDRHYACPRCGGADVTIRDGVCARCVLATELRRCFGENAQLAALIQDLERSDHPEAVLYWLRRETSSAALRHDLLAGGLPLSHELLDTLPHRTAAVHLRQLLVSHDILPDRAELVARTEAWVQRLLDQTEPQHHALLRPYATWVVLHRIRCRDQAKGLTDSSVSYAREQVRCALGFLRWLADHGCTIEQATQADVDHWLTQGTTTRLRLRDFLRWTNRCKITFRLQVPSPPNGDPATFLDEDHHAELLRRCAHDDTWPIDVRAAGALVLLYGARLSRIARLTHRDLTHDGDQMLVTFGGASTPVPPAVARLLTTQATVRPRTLSQHAPGAEQTPWLFPGALVGRPIAPHRLRQRLANHGIEVRPGRNSAVLGLAQDLPAPIVSSLLDLHVNTAVYWAKRGKNDWTSYLQTRSRN